MLKYFVLLLIVAVTFNEACPSIKNRASWGARNAKNAAQRIRGKAQYVIVHHTAGNECNSNTDCSNQIKVIQSGHIDRSFDDIGYNFLIDKFGNIYEGRGWGVSGAHAKGYNSKSVGISVLGNYQNSELSESAKKAIKDLIACGVSNGKISSNYKLLGHRQTKATECPGKNIFNEIKTWPRWSSVV